MLPGWAVVVAEPAFEAKAVAAAMRLGHQVFYPKLVKRVRKKGKRSYLICPLFPGYFFVWLEKICYRLLEARAVVGLLTSGDAVATVREEAMQQLREQCDLNGVYTKPLKVRFAPGQKVLASWGLLAGQCGIYESRTTNQEIALFDILGAQRRVSFTEGNLVAVAA